MPLSMVGTGKKFTIQKIKGKDETIRHLENLGFVEGTCAEIISESEGNLIINIKGSRVALGRDLANKIMVS